MKITVTHDDGTTVDITEGVQVTYDCVVQSMDWGSGFLDTEEVDAIVRLAEACRFSNFEEIMNEVWKDRTSKGVDYDVLNAMAQERGAQFWSRVTPTEADRAALLRQIHENDPS